MQIPAFVINLDSRPDRWAAMSKQLARLGIEAQRIPAVDARLLAAQEESAGETNGNPPFWRINLGAAAGMLGHSRAMIDLLGSNAPAALILEDDAELAPDTPRLLDSVDWWPAGAHVVRLESHVQTSAGLYKSSPLTSTVESRKSLILPGSHFRLGTTSGISSNLGGVCRRSDELVRGDRQG